VNHESSLLVPSPELDPVCAAGGAGLVLGPVVGGVLFDAGGFRLPFFVMTGAILMLALGMYCILSKAVVAAAEKQAHRLSMITILSNPVVLLAVTNVVLAMVAFSALDPTVAPFLQERVSCGYLSKLAVLNRS
jgi:predicted MFS family arabinose efflux permease